MKILETVICQAQPSNNKGTTNTTIVRERDKIDEGKKQIKETGEEKISEISEDSGAPRREGEEG